MININSIMFQPNEIPEKIMKKYTLIIMVLFFFCDFLFAFFDKNKKIALIVVGLFCLLRLIVWCFVVKPITVFDEKAMKKFCIVFFSFEALFCGVAFSYKMSINFNMFIKVFFFVVFIYTIVFFVCKIIIRISSKREKKESSIKYLIISYLICSFFFFSLSVLPPKMAMTILSFILGITLMIAVSIIGPDRTQSGHNQGTVL